MRFDNNVLPFSTGNAAIFSPKTVGSFRQNYFSKNRN